MPLIEADATGGHSRAHQPSGDAVAITWLGHATVLVETGGERLLTDPVLRGRVAHLRRHGPVPGVGPDDVDAVLVSHLHHDHLDTPSLRALRTVPRAVVAPGAGELVRAALDSDVVELAPGEGLDLDGVRITATAAEHDGGRLTPRGVIRGTAVGFLVEAGSTRIYFAGDTGAFPRMEELAPVDVALLPVWGWGATVGPGHLDPEQAAAAAATLHARVAIPIHWGTFLPAGFRHRHAALLTGPGAAFAEAAARLAPGTGVELLSPGDSVRRAG